MDLMFFLSSHEDQLQDVCAGAGCAVFLVCLLSRSARGLVLGRVKPQWWACCVVFCQRLLHLFGWNFKTWVCRLSDRQDGASFVCIY